VYQLTGDYGRIYLGSEVDKHQITSTKSQTNSNAENPKSQTEARAQASF
jgi:hypothetical protein